MPEALTGDTNFTWRRIFAAVTTIWLLILDSVIVGRVLASDGDVLRSIAMFNIIILGLVICLYMIAPSAEQIVKMLQAAKISVNLGPLASVSTSGEGVVEAAKSAAANLLPESAPWAPK